MEVVSNLRYVGGITDEEMLCAAALHDVIEQTEASAAEIKERFGTRVRDLVVEMTRTEPSPEQSRGLDESGKWQLRSNLLLEDIRRMSADAQRLKLADRLSNVQGALRTKIEGKLHRHLDQTKQILQIVPREVNEGLWDGIQSLLSLSESWERPVAT
jgi:(p)ppGpp synthase/HD superfamily hydrolase